MFVKDKDQDGYNEPLSIWRNTQRSEIIMAHPSSVELPRYFDQFRFSHSTRLYYSLRIFTHCPLQTLTFFNILYAKSILTCR